MIKKLLFLIAHLALNFSWGVLKSQLVTIQFQERSGEDFVMTDWRWSVGVALPSWKYFPAAWTIITIEKPTGKKFHMELDRWLVGDEFV
jgi:hypothetical protein